MPKFFVLCLCVLLFGCDSDEFEDFDFSVDEVRFRSPLVNSDGTAAIGVTATLWAGNRRYSNTTGGDGVYEITVPANTLPTSGEISISLFREGDRPRTVNFDASLIEAGSLWTLPASSQMMTSCPDCISITNTTTAHELWHLGDDNFSGTVNSQFQRSSITSAGLLFFFNEPIEANIIYVTFKAKGIQGSRCGGVVNYGTVNTRFGQNLLTDSRGDGSYGFQRYAFQAAGQGGESVIGIIPGTCSDGDVDDFEIDGFYVSWE